MCQNSSWYFSIFAKQEAEKILQNGIRWQAKKESFIYVKTRYWLTRGTRRRVTTTQRIDELTVLYRIDFRFARWTLLPKRFESPRSCGWLRAYTVDKWRDWLNWKSCCSITMLINRWWEHVALLFRSARQVIFSIRIKQISVDHMEIISITNSLHWKWQIGLPHGFLSYRLGRSSHWLGQIECS